MSKTFWKAVAIRAAHTFLQSFVGCIGGATLIGDVNWGYVLSASALATLISVCKSVMIGLPEVDTKVFEGRDV